MNRRILTLICILFVWTSCSQENEKELTLFNDYKFAKDSTEHVADRDSVAQKAYQAYFNNMEQVQVPLYRVLEGKGYHIYLGIPFHATLEKMVKLRIAQPMADSVLQLSGSSTSFYRRFIKDSLYLTEYIRPLDSVSIICVYAVTKDAQIAATLLSEEQLKARIIK